MAVQTTITRPHVENSRPSPALALSFGENVIISVDTTGLERVDRVL